MNVERGSPLPGLNKKCGDCRRQLKDGPFESGYPCKAAYAPGGYPLQPKIEVGADGSFICDRYKSNLATLINNWVGRVSVFAITRGIQLPQ